MAQPIRLLLHYLGTEFEDKYFVCGPAPGFDKSCWFDIKDDLPLDFPNVRCSFLFFPPDILAECSVSVSAVALLYGWGCQDHTK